MQLAAKSLYCLVIYILDFRWLKHCIVMVLTPYGNIRCWTLPLLWVEGAKLAHRIKCSKWKITEFFVFIEVWLFYSAVTETARCLWEPMYILLWEENRSKLVSCLLTFYLFFKKFPMIDFFFKIIAKMEIHWLNSLNYRFLTSSFE